MKKREDMIRDVHQRIDAYETEHRAKRAKVRKAFPALAAIIAAKPISVPQSINILLPCILLGELLSIAV